MTRLPECKPDRHQACRAGADEDGLGSGTRCVLGASDPSRRAGVGIGDGQQYPDHEHQSGHVGRKERCHRPRGSLAHRERGCRQPADRAGDHAPGCQPRVLAAACHAAHTVSPRASEDVLCRAPSGEVLTRAAQQERSKLGPRLLSPRLLPGLETASVVSGMRLKVRA